MEFDIFLGVAALVIAAVLTWCILRFFFAPRRGGARATLHDGVQQATITVRGGYSPDIVTMQAGIPITLRFDRKETGECTSHVVFPDLGTDTMLPGNETTEMSLPPLPAGDYPFACGMNMVHGLLRVEGETDSATKPDDGTASTGTAIPAGTPRMSAADALLAEAKSAAERTRAQALQSAHQEAAQATRAMRARVRDEETAAAAAVDAKLPELVTALTGGLLGSDAAERNAAQIRQWVAPAHEG